MFSNYAYNIHNIPVEKIPLHSGHDMVLCDLSFYYPKIKSNTISLSLPFNTMDLYNAYSHASNYDLSSVNWTFVKTPYLPDNIKYIKNAAFTVGPPGDENNTLHDDAKSMCEIH